jgi:hypothetical protein
MRGCVSFLLASVLAAIASAVTITFDEAGPAPSLFANANPLRTQYIALGIDFFGPAGAALDGGAILHQDGNFGISAHSGTNFLAFNRSAGVFMLNGGRPLDPEHLVFSTPITSISIFASGGFSPATFALSGFDAANNRIGTTIIDTAAGQWGQLTLSGGNMFTVTLVEISNRSSFVYDDLSFTPVPEPATLAFLGLGATILWRRRR